MTTPIDIQSILPMSWVLTAKDATTSGQQMTITQGRRRQDKATRIVLDAGTYTLSLDYLQGEEPYGSWFSVYVNSPGSGSYRVFGERGVDGPRVRRLTIPVDKTELAFYCTKIEAEKDSPLFVGVSLYPVPLANQGE